MRVGVVVSAYNDFDNIGCRWQVTGSPYFPIYYKSNPMYPPYGDYASAFSAARTSWSGASAPYFSYSGTSLDKSLHGVRDFGTNSIAGQTVECPLGTGLLDTAGRTVTLNSRVLDDPSHSNIFWKQFVAANELGHNIALGHALHLPAIMQKALPPDSFRTDIMAAWRLQWTSCG